MNCSRIEMNSDRSTARQGTIFRQCWKFEDGPIRKSVPSNNSRYTVISVLVFHASLDPVITVMPYQKSYSNWLWVTCIGSGVLVFSRTSLVITMLEHCLELDRYTEISNHSLTKTIERGGIMAKSVMSSLPAIPYWWCSNGELGWGIIQCTFKVQR